MSAVSRHYKGFIIGAIIALALPALAVTYNYFIPGGAISCTGACTQQSVDLTQSGFVSGPLRVGAGGIGVNTLTGLAKGNGTSAFTTATASDVTTLSAANPSGLIGLTATNGVATTLDRSDSTHALDQSIAPSWTGAHSFSATQTETHAWSTDNGGYFINTAGIPMLTWNDTSQAANARRWRAFVGGVVFQIDSASDNQATSSPAFQALRGAGVNTLLSVTLGNSAENPSVNVAGTLNSTGTGLTVVGSGSCSTQTGSVATSFVYETQPTNAPGNCILALTFAKSAAHGYACYGSNVSAGTAAAQTARGTSGCTLSVSTPSNNQVVVVGGIGY